MVNKHGEFIWYELCTPDADGAQAFYSAVIGWDIADSLTPDMDYRIVHATDDDNGERVPVGALAQLPDVMQACGAQPVWLGYIAVDDVDASVNRIVAAGGAVSMPATDIANVGRIALVTDPQGAPFYLMRGIHDSPSAAFAADRPRVGHCAWNELATADPDAAKAFYFAEFGWSKDGEMPMGAQGNYEFIRHNGLIGAVMPKPDERPASLWNYYFRVANIDLAVEAIGASGGTLVMGPEEIPGGDFIVIGIDPQGALFSLIGARSAQS